MITQNDVYWFYLHSNFSKANTLWKDCKFMLQEFILLSFMLQDIFMWVHDTRNNFYIWCLALCAIDVSNFQLQLTAS